MLTNIGQCTGQPFYIRELSGPKCQQCQAWKNTMWIHISTWCHFFLSEKLPLKFLVTWLCWRWIVSTVLQFKIFVLILIWYFLGYRILDFFPQYFKDVAPLFSCLHWFPKEIYCHPYLCSYVCIMFFFFSCFSDVFFISGWWFEYEVTWSDILMFLVLTVR